MHGAKRVRETIAFKPIWDKTYQNWTAAFMRKNAWRCDRVNDIDDLVQEAYFVFAKICRAYPRVMCPKRFFCLYKRSITNKVHDWSCHKRRRQPIEPVVLPKDVSEFFIGRIGEIENAGYVAALLNEAPEEVKLVLGYLSKNGAYKLPEAEGKRENLSMRLCRALGLPSASDPIQQLKKLLTA